MLATGNNPFYLYQTKEKRVLCIKGLLYMLLKRDTNLQNLLQYGQGRLYFDVKNHMCSINACKTVTLVVLITVESVDENNCQNVSKRVSYEN